MQETVFPIGAIVLYAESSGDSEYQVSYQAVHVAKGMLLVEKFHPYLRWVKGQDKTKWFSSLFSTELMSPSMETKASRGLFSVLL